MDEPNCLTLSLTGFRVFEKRPTQIYMVWLMLNVWVIDLRI